MQNDPIPPPGLVRPMTAREEQRVMDILDQVQKDIAILMRRTGFLKSPTFWIIIGACLAFAAGGYGYTTSCIANIDQKREKDRDAFSTRIDTLIGQSADIKVSIASYGRQIDVDTKRIDRLECGDVKI